MASQSFPRSALTKLSHLLRIARTEVKVEADLKTNESSQRLAEFQRHLQAAIVVFDRKPLDFNAYTQACDKCIFVEGVASPSDFMALIFRRRCKFMGGNIYVVNDRERFDTWLPFDLWSLIADFVAPRLPSNGVSVAEKKSIHFSMSACLKSSTAFKDSDGGDVGSQFIYDEQLHHISSLIELDKSIFRSERADLYLRHGNYKAALVDYNYDLFHRDPPLPPRETESLYRNRSDALYGMNDVGGAVDSRTNAIRVSANQRLVESDMATIDKWLEELRTSLNSRTGNAFSRR